MATRNKKPTGNRLAEIVAYRRSQGSSVTGSLAGGIKERLKEKFDPRQLLNQRGLLTALFPGLKTYSAKVSATDRLSKTPAQLTSFDEIKPTLEIISFNTKMTAKNTMVLPALHRDVNVIRQNIVKLVKMKGGDARTKADMYFVNAKEREEKYERELKREKNKKEISDKIQEENSKKSKGILGTIFSGIVSGLKTIVESLAKLGKTLFSTFKFLAEVIVDVLGAAIGFISKPLKFLGGILKDFIGDFFKNRMLYLLISSIVQGVTSSIFGLLFSKKTLVRLGYYLLGVFASTFGLQWAAESYRKSSMVESPLDETASMQEKTESAIKSSEIWKSLLQTSEEKSKLPSQITKEEFEELKKSKILPQNATREATVGRESGIPGRQMQVSEGMFTDIIPGPDELGAPIQNALFNSESYKDFYKLKNKGLYKVPVPGLKDPLTLLLTKEEAMDFGKKTTMYDLTMEALKSEVRGNNPDSNLVQGFIKKLNDIKSDLSEKSLSLVQQQYNKEYKEYDLLVDSLTRLKEGSKGLSITDVMVQDITNAIMNSDIGKSVQEKFAEPIDEFIKKNKIDSLSDLRNNEMLKSLREKIENRSKDFQSNFITEKTKENTRSSVVFKKEPVVINQQSLVKNNNPINKLGSPASAWNNDFIDKYFDNIISNPLGIK